MTAAATMQFSLGEADDFAGRFAAWLTDFEPGVLSGDQARQAAELFAKLARLAQAAAVLATNRVDATSAYARGGCRSAASFLAGELGTSNGHAAAALETANRLAVLPASEQAFRSGELSLHQAAAISDAAIGSPELEAGLLDAARTGPLAELQRKSREIKLRQDHSSGQRERRHHKRSFRAFSGDDSMRQYVGQLPPEMAAEVEAVWNVFRDRAYRQARVAGRKERHDQYMADGLLAMARAANANLNRKSTATRPAANDEIAKPVKTRVIVRLDGQCIVNDQVGAGEVCEIVGLGPIDVATAKAMFSGAVIDFVVHNGIDITTVAHAGRNANAAQLAALLSREYVCETETCGHRQHLQIDHIDEYAKTRRTDANKLGWKCCHCHDLKTNHGYHDGPLQPNGKRKLIPPDTG